MGHDFHHRVYTDFWELALRYSAERHPLAVPCALSRYYNGRAQDQLTNEGMKQPAVAAVERNTVRKNPMSLQGAEKLGYPLLALAPRNVTPKYQRGVEVIIPSYEAAEAMELCLRSLVDYTPTGLSRIIVVDNNSSAAIRELLCKWIRIEPRLTVLWQDHNYGFTHAVNSGLALTQMDHDVVLLNNDAIATPGWLDAFREVFDHVSDVGLVMPRQTLLPNTETAQMHVPVSFAHREIDVTLSAHHANVVDPFLDSVRGFIQVSFAPFFCVYIPRETLNAAGNLDVIEGPHYKSDKLYCKAVHEILRKRIVYTPHSKFYHLLQQATKELKVRDINLYHSMYRRNSWTEILNAKPRHA